MSNGTVTVKLLARHNLGNYEHTEASVEITQALRENEDAAEAVINLQRRIAPLITAKHVAGLMAAASDASAAQPQPLAEPQPDESPKEQLILDLALDAADMLTPAGKQAAAVDPLAEPATPKKRGPGRPRKDAAKDVLTANTAGDPLTETAAPPKTRTEDSKTQFQTILAWVKQDLENAAALTRVLSATGYSRLIDVPPEQLGDLMVALGISD